MKIFVWGVLWMLFCFQSTLLAQHSISLDTVLIESASVGPFNERSIKGKRSKVCANNHRIGQPNYFSSHTFGFKDSVRLKSIELPVVSRIDSNEISIEMILSNHDSTGTLLQNEARLSFSGLFVGRQIIELLVSDLVTIPGFLTISVSISGNWSPNADRCPLYVAAKFVKNELQFSLHPNDLSLYKSPDFVIYKSPDAVKSSKVSPNLKVYFTR